MSVKWKRLLLIVVLLLFLFALIRIGTSTYENIVRDLPKLSN